MINLFENVYNNNNNNSDDITIILNGLELFYRKSSKGFVHLCLEEKVMSSAVVFNWKDMEGKFELAYFKSLTIDQFIKYVLSHFIAMSRLKEIADNQFAFI